MGTFVIRMALFREQLGQHTHISSTQKENTDALFPTPTPNWLLTYPLPFFATIAEILSRYGKTYGFELKAKLMGLREKEVLCSRIDTHECIECIKCIK
jgi:hypothetical protein